MTDGPLEQQDRLAAALYPTMAPPNPAPAESSDTLLGGAPASPAGPGGAPAGAFSAPMSESDFAHALYHNSIVAEYGNQLKESFDRLSDLTGMSAAERDATLRELAEVFDDARIRPDADASRLHSLMVTHTTTPPTDEQVQAWTVESRRYLRERFGSEADAVMAKARAFLAARPGFGALLTTTGLGSHPDVVKALTQDVHNLRLTPRRKR